MSVLWDGRDIDQLGRVNAPPLNQDVDGPLSYRDSAWALRRLNVTLANDLRWHRRRLGLSLGDAAAEIGISKGTVSRIEANTITLHPEMKFVTVWIVAAWLAKVENEDR